MIDRRGFIGAAVALVGTLPLPVEAQTAKLLKIGVLGNASPTTGSSQGDAIRRGLRELGWIEGETVTIEYRWADGNLDRLRTLVNELVQSKVDVIVLSGP
jgi:putative ABC transport system substrate-binding protein